MPPGARFIVSSPVLAEQAAALRRFAIASRSFHSASTSIFGVKPNVGLRAEQIRSQAARPLVVFAGRHVPYKGVQVLIEAAAPLDVTVAILGDGPMRTEWAGLAAQHHGPGTFLFPGEVDDDEMHAYLIACDMFVLPSVTPAEAFGFVQLEAMACGKPVISTALPTGVPWVNETGVVVPPHDVEALRRAIVQLAADRTLAVRLGAAGEARARADFAMSDMADRLVAVCHDLAGGRRH